ncbi:FAD-binding oxidoreductase [Azospirillum sp. RWY-5-1]|uniref:FAD-binding oxidoreductase n=1 Tax=Azospirillum oleiclasticum TaxID=2735135 RepID=A0ABX2THW2_9PROT|nr:FAD-binding oxidoreductase [Azospirillum oleiclasticum]NYZ15133.1 FAD-binding oxidoreductase [Azospirillum oleiclasticum]NYZ22896.1 FAD-binding oxidoreductase [Azospirillum oleiclasticum]
MQPPVHTRSWYAETANPHPRHPALEGETVCDVCVVGGGYTGLMTALELAERGYDVVLLEAERVGWGASGRNGGQLITGYNKPMSTIESWVGAEDARRLWDLNVEATDLLRRRVEAHAIACDLTWGFLYAAVKPRHLDDIAAIEADLGERYDYRLLTRLDRAGVATVVRSDAYLGGLFDAGSGHLHPLNYALGLAGAAVAARVRLFEGSRALAVDTGPAPRVTTAGGSVRARWLVLGCNAYIDGLAPRLEGWIMPVATYMMATEPLGRAAAATLLPAGAAVSDMNFVLNYFRRSPDHRLLFGGGVSYSGLDRPGLQLALRRKMLRVFPELDNARIDHVWGGHVAITMNRMPQVGRLSPTSFYAHGYSGHGVALAGMAGRTIAEAVAGTAERFDVFARIPHHPFPGGRWLRTPALVLAMLWFRLRDLL